MLFCFAFDSVIDYRGQFSSSFSATEFAKSSILEKKIFNDVFYRLTSYVVRCKTERENDSLSLPVTSSFLIENDNISNPVILSGQAISSSAIRLS